MEVLRTLVAVIWVAFWVYWLVAARGLMAGSVLRSGWTLRLLVVLVVVVLVRLNGVRFQAVAVHSLALGIIGLVVVVAGLGLAVRARVELGRSWGLPMSQNADPQLVTSGPYRWIRHPIYTGLVLGLVGTALTVSLYGLLLAAVVGAYFYHAARIEERNLVAHLPAYQAYRARTKLMIPFVL